MTQLLIIDDEMRRMRHSRPTTPRSPTFDKLEKNWFRAALRCDFEQLKRYYSKDHLLLDKKDNFTGALVHWAAKKGQQDILVWLAQNNADLANKTGYTALHIAAMHGREHIIRKLVNDYEQNLDCRDYSGRKPKHYLDENSSRNIRCILSPVKKTDALDVPDENPTSNHKSISPRLLKHDHHKNEENKTKHRPTLSLSNSFKRTKKLLEKHSPGSSPKDIRRYKTFSHFDFHITSPRTPRIRTLKIEHPHLKNRPTVLGHFDDLLNNDNNNNNSSINNNGILALTHNGHHNKSKNENNESSKSQNVSKSLNGSINSIKKLASSHSLRRRKSKTKLTKDGNSYTNVTKKNSEAPSITTNTNGHSEEANSQWTVWI